MSVDPWVPLLRGRDVNLPDGVTVQDVIVWTDTHLQGERLTLACIAFLVWDWLITLDDEWDYIWRQNPFTPTKSLFVINRYFTIAHTITRFWRYLNEQNPRWSVYACTIILNFVAYAAVFSVAVVEIILLLRLWAIHERNKKFGYLLIGFYIVGLGLAMAIRAVEPADSMKLVHEAPLSLTICPRSSASELFFLYLIVLIMETMTFALLLRKVWILSAVGVAPILQTMLKHGAQYYFAVFLALLFQVLGTVSQPLWQPMADALPIVAVASVACSRLVLSLRGMYTAPRHITTIQDFEARPGGTGAARISGAFAITNSTRMTRDGGFRLSTFRAAKGPKSPTETTATNTIDTYRGYEQGLELGTFSPLYSRLDRSPIHEEISEGDTLNNEESTPRTSDPFKQHRHLDHD